MICQAAQAGGMSGAEFAEAASVAAPEWTAEVRSQLTDFAQSGGALDTFEATFGGSFDAAQATEILAQWQAGDFAGLPKIVLADEGGLNGARAAYSQDTGTIYLSANWALDDARAPGEVARVIVEEIGHALDARLNTTDAAGDEGEFFTALVFGDTLDVGQIEAIRAEDDSGTITVDGQALAVEQAAGDISYEKLVTYSAGISQALASVENALANKVFAQALPLFGDDLNSAFTAASSAAMHALRGIQTFKDAVQGAIDNAIVGGSNGTQYSGTNIATAVNNALNNAGFTGSPVSFNTTNGEWSFNNTGSFMLNSQPLSGNLGLGPGNLVQLTGTASANLGLSYGVGLTIGSDTGGFYVRGDTANELSLNMSASTLNLGGGVQLGGLQLFSANVATDPSRPTDFTANFALDLRDGQNGTTNDGKIYIGEMGTAGFQILNPTVTGGLNLNVDLRTLDALEGVVKIETDFGVDWDFAGSTNGLFGSAPVVSFKNTDVSFLSFLTDVLLPFVENVKSGIEPIRDILDILRADIGALSNMPGDGADFLDVIHEANGFVAGKDGKISLLDIAKYKNLPGIDTALTLYPILDAVVTWYDFLTGPLASAGLMSVGDFTITDDIRDATFVLSGAGASVTGVVDDLHDFIDAQFAPSAAATLGNMLSNGPSAPNQILAPLLTDPQQALGYLFGRNIDILKFNLPKVGFSFGSGIEADGSFNGSLQDIFQIPIFLPGLNIEVEAALRAVIDIDFGYDTSGISQYLLSGSFLPGANPAPNPLLLLNGFYITDWDENGQDRPELVLGAQVNFGLGAGIDGLLKAFVGGKIEGVVNLDIIDGGGGNPQDGKVHYNELIGSLSDPLNLFEGRGAITASLLAYVEHLFGTHEWSPLTVTLAKFNFGGQGSAFNPGLATLDAPNDELTLNIGINAGQRLIADKLDGNEQFSIVEGPGVGRFSVIAFGQQQSFDNVGTIYAWAGSGNDIISMEETLAISVDFDGGAGDDALYGGAAADILSGGDNSDYLVGGGGADQLFGGNNEDVLDGGAGGDTLDGGGGIDLVTYIRSASSIGINLDTGATGGGDSAGDILISIENIVGADIDGAGDMIFGIDGGTVANVFNGLKGNDTLYGGGGDDTLIGGDGNDIVDGGLGADILSGGHGDDTYGVDSLLDVIDENRFGGGSGRDRIISAIDINIEALTDIEELQLFGSARIAEANALDNLVIGTEFGDTLRGLGGADTIQGGGGADSLEGGADVDNLQGQAGDDTLIGGAGADTMAGGIDNDTYIVADAGDIVTELVGQGTDTVRTSVNYVLTAGSEVERIETTDADGLAPLELGGNAFAQRLVGNAGNNVLQGFGGADTLDGGNGGHDVASYENAASVIALNLTTGGKTGDALGDVYIAIDSFRGTNIAGAGDRMTGAGGADSFNGLGGDDSLFGLGGDDTLFGGLGNDAIDGGTGNDVMAGGAGDDTYMVDSLLDVVDDDRDGYLNGGGGGRDLIITGLNYSLGGSLDRSDIEDLTITGAARSATGNSIANRITGTTGNDTIDGAGGSDDLRGGLGNDIYFFDSVGDRVVEDLNAGTDEIRVATAGFYNVGPGPSFTQSPYTINMQDPWLVNVEDVVLLDNARVVHLTGNDLNNRLVSNDQSSSLIGGLGNDTLVTGHGRDNAAGGDGLDTLVVDWSSITGGNNYSTFTFLGDLATGYSGRYTDQYNGTAGYNLVDFSGIERFIVSMGATHDSVRTGDYDDNVSGGGGNDHLITGKGIDIVDGGLGDDRWEADKLELTSAQPLVLNLRNVGLQSTYAGTGKVSNIEMLTLITGDGADDITTLQAFHNDQITTNGGVDKVTIAGGRDNIAMGDGFDTLVLDWSAITGGNSYSTFTFAGTLATGYSGRYTDQYNGTAGYNLVDFSGVERFDFTLGATNDTVRTGDYADTVSGGGGNDHLITGKGIDIIDGGAGTDRWEADKFELTADQPFIMNLRNVGLQSTYAGTGKVSNIEMLTLITGDGADDITTLQAFHDDQITTNGGADKVTIAGGRDNIAMGDGFDTLVLDWSAITGGNSYSTFTFAGSLEAGYSGRYTDQYNGTAGYNLVDFSGVERFDFTLGATGDIVRTGDYADSVSSGGGNDFLSTGKGADIIDGGKTLIEGVLVSGVDRWLADKSDATVGMTIDLEAVSSSYVIDGVTGTVTNIEALGEANVAGKRFASGDGDDSIVTRADYLSDFIETNLGADTVTVKGGKDTVHLGDNVAGTFDTLIVDWAAQTGNNFTTLGFTLGADGYSGRFTDQYDGTAGYNSVHFSGVERFNVTMGVANDYVLTGDFNDIVSGGDGNDRLSTGKGIDIVDGGLGNDRWEANKFELTTAQPFVINLRNDGLQSTYAGTGKVSNIEMLTLITGAGADDITTLQAFHDDQITTNGGADKVTIAGGRDNIALGDGVDTLVVDWSAISGGNNYSTFTFAGDLATGYSGRYTDQYNGTAGYNLVDFSGVEHFNVSLGATHDTVRTGDYADTVSGGGGNDHLITGKGIDIVDGGLGDDRWEADKLELTTAQPFVINLRNDGLQSTYAGTGKVSNIEMLTLITGAGADDITTLQAFHNDQITTNGGADKVTIAGGRDNIAMGDGVDTLVVDWSTINGGNNYSTFSFAGTLATGYSGRYTDQYNGTAGYNLVDFSGVERFNVAMGTTHDTVVTGDGNDNVSGGGGNDFLLTGKGADIIDGGIGTDRWMADKSDAAFSMTIDLTAASSTYVVAGVTATVTNIEVLGQANIAGQRFASGAGNDRIVTLTDYLSDFIETNAGADTVTVRGGKDIVQLGDNAAGTFDTLVVDWATQTGNNFTTLGFTLGADGYSGRFTDQYDGTAGYNSVHFSGVERFNVTMGVAHDYVLTGDFNDIVSGGDGNDRLSTGKGIDIIDGGAGNDRWEANKFDLTTAQPFIMNLRNVGLQSTYAGTGTVRNIEMLSLITGEGADVITTLQAFHDDQITTNGGADKVTIAGGRDNIALGDGVDTLVVDWSAVNGGNNYTTFTFAGTLATGYSGRYTDQYNGTAGYNLVDFSGVEHFNVAMGATHDTIITGDGNDILSGGGGNDLLQSAGGDDQLDGGVGNDRMVGGAGNDTYIVDSIGDLVFETTTTASQIDAGGVDTVQSSVTINLDASAGVRFVERLTLTGTDNIDGVGNALANLMIGNSGNNRLNGGLGNDIMGGGAGNDIYVVDSVSDSVFETTTISSLIDAGGIDTIESSVTLSLDANAAVRFVENLTLTGLANINGTGNALANVLLGNTGNNTLSGLGGNDTLDGGAGTDGMSGGSGDDTYVVDNIGDRVYETTTPTSGIDSGGIDTVQSSVTMSLDVYDGVRFVENLTLIGAANINGVGNALANLLIGNSGNNTLNGGLGNDTMGGGEGNDIYVVDSIGDRVFETTTVSSLIDAGGIDTVQSSVTLNLDANAGVRFVERLTLTGAANLIGTGNALDNVLTGNAGNNTLSGLGGNDTLDGGAGTDGMSGGSGDDTYIVDNIGDRVYETTTPTSGIDTGGVDTVLSSVTMSLNAYAAVRFVENLTLTGAVSINAFGNALDNVLNGNIGNNTLDGGLGNDTMGGGAGNDIYIVDSIDDQVFETTTIASAIDAGGVDTIQSSVALNLDANAGLRFVERLTLTGAANIDGVGNALANVLLGNSGNNTLDGGLGVDLMVGGAGNDIYVVDNAGDRVFETTTVSTQIDAGGVDTMLSSISTSIDAYIGVRFVENLTLTGVGNLVAVGNALANELIGNTGNNTLNGGLGADTMGGGAGNDIYVVDNVGDQVFETTTVASGIDAGGVDTIQSSVDLSLDANAGLRFVERLTLTGTGNINGTGNALANVLLGNGGNNILDGGLGNDIMGGGAGNDTYVIDNIGDLVFETTTISTLIDAGGVDTIQSSLTTNLDAAVGVRFVENLTLTGIANINGTGNALANVLTGNDGNNTLNGGLGNDVMIGGLGGDTFVFNTTLGASNIDQITGFSVVDDTIRLDDAIFVGLTPGTLAGIAFAANLTGEAATDFERIIYETDTGALFYDSDGVGTLAARVQFATLAPGLALTNSDFFVI